MKRFLTIAAMLVASVTAAQAKSTKTLPSTVIGSWCFADQDKTANVTTYSRGKCTGQPKGVDVFADNYSGTNYSCVINRVDQLSNGTTNKEAYWVHADCVNDESGSSRWKDNSMFQLIGGELSITPNFTKKDADWRPRQEHQQ